MESLNTIKIIHAADADQHLGHLKKILDELKNENRIKDYSTLESESVNENSLASLSDGDMVITLLTNGIGPVKTLIEETMLKAKTRLPEAKMAEIIIDHVPYENQFIAFPSDLQPIRSREDMDGVWNKIGQTLREIFPIQEEPDDPVAPVPWKKYLPYALGALALIILFLIIPAPDEDEMNVVSIETSVSSLESDTDDCPKQFDFTGNIKVNAPGKVAYTWVRSDGQPASVDTLRFEEAGEKQVSSSWVLGSDKEKYEEWQQLKILSPNAMVSDEEAIVFECKGKEVIPKPKPNTDPVIPVLNDATATAQVSGNARVGIDCGKRHRFNFSGIIKANGKGKVNYAWVGNDGKTSPMQTLVFQNAGSQKVSTTKTLVASSEKGYEGWQQLKILTPSESYSDVAKFILVCKKKVETFASAIKLASLSPASNKTLKTGTRVNFRFGFQTKYTGGVRILGRPMYRGKLSSGYATNKGSTFSSTDGSGSGYFTLTKAGDVDQIQFIMFSTSEKKLIFETFVPVKYKFYQSVVGVHPRAVLKNATVLKTAAPARTEGSFVVKQTWNGDFDMGRQVPSKSPPSEKDFWFNARTATNRAIVPQNKALISIMKSTNPSRTQVITAIKDGTEKEIDVNKLVPGVWVAVLTSKGRYAAFTTVRKVGPSPGVLSVKFRRW